MSRDKIKKKIVLNNPCPSLNPSTGGEGFELPIEKYVYLVQDEADAVRMGGTPANVYTNFNSAYNAANTIQLASFSSDEIVRILVIGRISQSLILNQDFNPFIHIVGLGASYSEVIDISTNNDFGNASNIGESENPVRISNLKFRNITAQATGEMGSGGNIHLILDNVIGANIYTYPSVLFNITGNSGDISIKSINGASTLLNVCNNLSEMNSTGITGYLTITATSRIKIQSIYRVNSGPGGTSNLILENVDVAGNTLTSGIVQRVTDDVTGTSNFSIKNCNIGFLTILDYFATSTLNIENTRIQSGMNIIGVSYVKATNIYVIDGQTSFQNGFMYTIVNSFFSAYSNGSYVLFIDIAGELFARNTTFSNYDYPQGGLSECVFIQAAVSVFFQGCNLFDFFGNAPYLVNGDPVVVNSSFVTQGTSYFNNGGANVNSPNPLNAYPIDFSNT